jgi:hypothetical protein
VYIASPRICIFRLAHPYPPAHRGHASANRDAQENRALARPCSSAHQLISGSRTVRSTIRDPRSTIHDPRSTIHRRRLCSRLSSRACPHCKRQRTHPTSVQGTSTCGPWRGVSVCPLCARCCLDGIGCGCEWSRSVTAACPWSGGMRWSGEVVWHTVAHCGILWHTVAYCALYTVVRRPRRDWRTV